MTTKRMLWIAAAIVSLATTIGLASDPPEEGHLDHEAGKSAKPMMQCPMMAGMSGIKMSADSPMLLLSQAEELGLSEEQQKKLDEIANAARQQARKLLTPEQQEKLKGFPEGSLTMMDLCKMRMKKMMAEKKQDGMMCPMCMKMMREKMGSKGSNDEHK